MVEPSVSDKVNNEGKKTTFMRVEEVERSENEQDTAAAAERKLRGETEVDSGHSVLFIRPSPPCGDQ